MLMRSPLARDRRQPPGFIRPCQPVLAATVPPGDGWLHELKHDGFRIVAQGTRLARDRSHAMGNPFKRGSRPGTVPVPWPLSGPENGKGIMKKASEYREHADECRALARGLVAGEQRHQLLEMAATWERLAKDRSELVRRHPELSIGDEHGEE